MSAVLVLAALGAALAAPSPAARSPAAPSPAADARPLPRYLDPDAVRATVQAQGPAFSACMAGRAGELSTRYALRIGRDGRVAEARLEPGTGLPEVDGCLREALAALAFAPHDEDPVQLGGTVAAIDGVLLPPLDLDLEARSPDLLYLYLPPDLDPALRARLLTALGLATEAPPPPAPDR